MLRVMMVTSDPAVHRGVLGELECFASTIAARVVHPSQVHQHFPQSGVDALLLDVQDIQNVRAAILTDAICGGHVRCGFVSCCTGCETDRRRIAAIEKAGVAWLALPASGHTVAAFLERLAREADAEMARAAFLAAFWELTAEAESVAAVPAPARRPVIASLADLLAVLLRQGFSKA